MSGTEAYERLGAAIVEQACKDAMRNPGEVRRFFCDNKSIFDLCMPTADGKRIYEQIIRNYAYEGHYYSADRRV